MRPTITNNHAFLHVCMNLNVPIGRQYQPEPAHGHIAWIKSACTCIITGDSIHNAGEK